ncbi:MAG: glycosyltransferase [Desulfobacteraceae bacterium]|nr:MAG: glycosyltransferase [Desulfobacteraceae bacterium]
MDNLKIEIRNMTRNSRFSIIVPAYNEEQSIRDTVLEIRRVFLKLEHPFEIIIVNDGSTDFTADIINTLANDLPEVKTVQLDHNYGKGYAIRKGVARADGDYIVFMDADLDIHPAQIDRVLNEFRADLYDVAIGSKRHPESVVDYPLSRRFISTIYYWIIRFLFGLKVRDTQAGFKIYKKEVLHAILPRLMVKKFAFDLEMLAAAHRLGFKIMEFPIRVTFSRKFGRIKLKDCWLTGIDTLAIFYRCRLLDFYDYPAILNTGTPKVSIVIAVKAPNGNLKRCIDACLRQDYENYEILIVPDHASMVLDVAFKHNERIKIIHSGAVNPSVKRNMGATAATGEILAFLDDDAFPYHDWISTAVRQFGNREIAAVGGPGVSPPESSLFERASGCVYASLLVSGTYRYRYTPHRYQEVDDYPSCNLFVLKTVFDAIGGFSSQYWPGEDTLLCREIVAGNKKIIYDPHVIVEHKRRPLFLKHLAQISRYAIHRGYFVKRWPENSLRFAYFAPSLFVLFILSGFPLAHFPVFRKIYLSLLFAYLGISLIASINISGIFLTVLEFTGIVSTHITYGVYFMIGLFKSNLTQHKVVSEQTALRTTRLKRRVDFPESYPLHHLGQEDLSNLKKGDVSC